MSRPKRKQRGGSACEFTQTLGGEILRQARELDGLPPDAIFGVYTEGTRNVLPPGRGIRRVVRIFRERSTGSDEPCFVVETRRAHVRFANVRHAVAAFALADATRWGGAAQPVGSLRVRGMRALSVWQRDASIAERDLN